MNDAMHPVEQPDPAVDAAWAAELRERIRAFKAGEMKAIPEEQALEEAEELIATTGRSPACSRASSESK